MTDFKDIVKRWLGEEATKSELLELSIIIQANIENFDNSFCKKVIHYYNTITKTDKSAFLYALKFIKDELKCSLVDAKNYFEENIRPHIKMQEKLFDYNK